MNNRITTVLYASTLALTSAFASTAIAGDPDYTVSVLVKQGDSFPPYGTVSNIDDISVNNNGDWIVDVSLTGGTASAALIKNGEVWVAVNDALETGTLTNTGGILKSLNNNGDVVWIPSIDGTAAAAVYFNFSPLLLKDQISTSPKFSENTPYIGIFRARLNDNGKAFAILTANDSELPGSVHRAVVWLSFDSEGNLVEEVVLRKHDPIPGAEEGVELNDVGTDAARFAVNNDNDAYFVASLLNSPATTNAALFINDQMVLRKGDTSPVDDEPFANISTSTRGHMNADRQYVFHTTIPNQPAGTNNFLFLGNGNTRNDTTVFFRQGDPAPDVPGETIDSFGTGAQPRITDDGDVVWYGRITGDATANQAIFVNDRLILRKGDVIPDHGTLTTVGGTTSTSNGIVKAFTTSDSGKYVLVRAVFDAGPRAAVLVEFDDTALPCPGDLTGSGSVGVPDLLELLSCWGPVKPGCEDADLTGSDNVGVPDLLDLLGQWGPCP